MRDLLLSLSCVAALGFALVSHAHDAPAVSGDESAPAYALAETINAEDAKRLVQLFAEDSLVLADRPYRGREEIRDWAQALVSAHARLEIDVDPTGHQGTPG